VPTPARRRSLSRERFPEYVALSKPQPVSLAETQGLIADDEALLVFEFDTKSYAWIITRDGADWTELKISARDLDEQVRALRAWVVDPRQRFDSALAYKIFQETFGAFAEKLAAEKRLSIVTNGALTSLPPQLLIAMDPTGSRKWIGSSALMPSRSCPRSRASKSCGLDRKPLRRASR
jgi:hypothetical protein